jgi:hypothetical protein
MVMTRRLYKIGRRSRKRRKIEEELGKMRQRKEAERNDV